MRFTQNDILQGLVRYTKGVYDTQWLSSGLPNIVYLEGANADFTPNDDKPDQWNDRSLLIGVNQGDTKILLNAQATSEPGLIAANSKAAEKLGGVARIAIGYHHEKWTGGFHKQNLQHPALVQCAPINVFRDKNKDGKRTGDFYTDDVSGLNQHGTRRGMAPSVVGMFSLACLVRRYWEDHLTFMQILGASFLSDYKFSTTVVDYSRFWRWMNG